jgi:hypothetical protein
MTIDGLSFGLNHSLAVMDLDLLAYLWPGETANIKIQRKRAMIMHLHLNPARR